MTSPRDLDYAPLAGGRGLATRLRAAGTNNLMVMAGTVGVLLVIVPVVVAVALFATGNATDVGGVALLAMLLAGGVYVLVDVLRKSGPAASLDDFARANDLTLVRGAIVPHYAGSRFADRSRAVHRSVRTQEEQFVEVGDSFPTHVPPGARRPNQPALFLRARLAGRAADDPHDVGLITRELGEALEQLAGSFEIEVAGDELTVFGSRELHPDRPGRVETAFALLDTLVARANATLVHEPGPAGRPDAAAPSGGPTSSGIPVPAVPRPPAPQGRTRGPLATVAWTLALVISGAFAIAVVMSLLDDHLRGAVATRLVVAVIVLMAIALVARVGRAMLSPRRRPGEARD